MGISKGWDQRRETILCPVCSTMRERPRRRLPRGRLALLTALFTAMGAATGFTFYGVSAAIWGAMSCGMVCFLSVEVYYSVQFRRELECPVCHFDPLLYRKSPEKAKAQCLEGLKRKEQVLGASASAARERARELHG